MAKELSLKVEFSKKIPESELMIFWESLIEEIEKHGLTAGGGFDSLLIDWVLDYSDSSLSKGEIIDEIGDFLLSRDDLILNFALS